MGLMEVLISMGEVWMSKAPQRAIYFANPRWRRKRSLYSASTNWGELGEVHGPVGRRYAGVGLDVRRQAGCPAVRGGAGCPALALDVWPRGISASMIGGADFQAEAGCPGLRPDVRAL